MEGVKADLRATTSGGLEAWFDLHTSQDINAWQFAALVYNPETDPTIVLLQLHTTVYAALRKLQVSASAEQIAALLPAGGFVAYIILCRPGQPQQREFFHGSLHVIKRGPTWPS